MISQCISNNWYFTEKNLRKYKNINLPHDYMLEGERDPLGEAYQGYFKAGPAQYVKYLKFKPDKCYILQIDGAYMCSDVLLNENYITMHPHGYTPLLVHLDEWIIDGIDNKLVIKTNPLVNSSRWYSGAGIYRDVYLWEGGSIRIEPWDLFVSTEKILEDEAVIRIKYTVSFDHKAHIKVVFKTLYEMETVAVCTKYAESDAGKYNDEFTYILKNPKLWDTENPHLYSVVAEVYEEDKVVDTHTVKLGVRTIAADPVHGFRLNGRSMKLRGGCIHHDHGGLGAKAYPKAEERKIKLLKDAGFNAVRISHNPPSLVLLDICDRVGMLVMDEAFDVWNKPKISGDYHLFFEDWWQRDIAYMVKRDRNHPSVISYSIGNEIREVDGTSNMTYYAHALSDEIRKYDDSRFVTSAIQKLNVATHHKESIDPPSYAEYVERTFGNTDQRDINRRTIGYEGALDIVGLNYHHQYYPVFHESNPDMVIWGSENWTLDFYDYWNDVKENNYNIGDFTWVAIDNLGEVGGGRFRWASEMYPGDVEKKVGRPAKYPWRSCFQGDFDLCGFRKPQSYYREAVWFEGTQPHIFVTHPKHYGEEFYGTDWCFYDVDECWTFEKEYIGKPVTVETYTDADKVLWYVNGKYMGESLTEKRVSRFNTVYNPGVITALFYKDGEKYAECSLETTGNPVKILVDAESEMCCADGRDLAYFDISITDRLGRLVNSTEAEISAEVIGGELLTLFSGAPASEVSFLDGICHTYKGRALAIVKAECEGEIKITVKAEGLVEGTATVMAKKV